MKRSDFLRNTLMGFAMSLLPKNLLPSSGDVINDDGDGLKKKIEAKSTPVYVYGSFMPHYTYNPDTFTRLK